MLKDIKALLQRIPILACIFIFIPIFAQAGYYEDDCYAEMSGSKKSVLAGRYITYDEAGVKEICRNEYKTVNERYILKREAHEILGHIYKVSRSYCWARNTFRDNSCSWPTGSAWGDTYSGIFLSGDARGLDDGEGRVILKSGGYNLRVTIDSNDKEKVKLTGSGLPGDHICLKRFAPKETMAHGVVNPYNRNAVCGYLVYARASDSCRNPVGGWESALIGCIEEPLKPGPPTFNTVMAAEIAPIVDPKVSFEEYITKYASTFDQPVIKLLNGEVSDGTEPEGDPKIGELVLRYKFDGDTTVKDKLPSSASFPQSKSKLVYKAKVDLNNPGQVCACEASVCDKRLYIGCVDRPTPRDSNLKVVAEYAQHSDKSPGVKVNFALTDANLEIIYYDADNQRVIVDNAGNAFKADQSGRPTTTPAKGPIGYKKLPLIPKEPIREYYVGNQDQPEKDRVYTRDVVTVYGVRFQAIIPRMKSATTPAFVTLDTAETRTDGCKALKIAEDQGNDQKPSYFIPAGDRDRTYCKCEAGKANCPVPASKGCGAGMTDNEEDAAKVLCPGKLKEPSQVDKSNIMCLQPASGWNFASYELDKLCTQIPTDCEAKPDPSISYGISAWGKVAPNSPATSVCDPQTGIEMLKVYQWNPPEQRPRNQFICEANTNCTYAYGEYAKQFGIALDSLNSLQALANALNRNLNDDEQNKLKKILGNFSIYHTLSIAPQAPPERSCSLNKEIAKDVGLVKNPCMIQNSCGEINKPAYITGFATWEKIGDADLEPKDKSRASRQMLAEILITAKGKCPTGYKEGKEAPSRVCSLKYVNGSLVGGGWQPVKTPCIPVTP